MLKANDNVSVGYRHSDIRRASAEYLDNGPYRMRSGGAATASTPNFGRRDGIGYAVLDVAKAIGRLILPVVLLLLVFLQLVDLCEVAVPYLPGSDGTYWLNGGHLMLPLAFFAVQLTNRRYGPGFAFAQVVLAFAAVLAFVLFDKSDAALFVRPEAVPPTRVALAFGAAFFVACFVSIITFDGARGPCWWSAPLVGFLTAALVFPAVFFPIAYIGFDSPWMLDGLTYMGVLAAAAIALLVPYYMMRGVVPPLSGFGGY